LNHHGQGDVEDKSFESDELFVLSLQQKTINIVLVRSLVFALNRFIQLITFDGKVLVNELKYLSVLLNELRSVLVGINLIAVNIDHLVDLHDPHCVVVVESFFGSPVQLDFSQVLHHGVQLELSLLPHLLRVGPGVYGPPDDLLDCLLNSFFAQLLFLPVENDGEHGQLVQAVQLYLLFEGVKLVCGVFLGVFTLLLRLEVWEGLFNVWRADK
jgi:hypothetical protein